MLKYKILHFLQDNELTKVKTSIEEIIESSVLGELKKRFKKLINKGTDHEIYITDAVTHLSHVYKLAKDSGIEQCLFPTNKDRDLIKNGDLQWTIDGDLMEFDFTVIETSESYSLAKP